MLYPKPIFMRTLSLSLLTLLLLSCGQQANNPTQTETPVETVLNNAAESIYDFTMDDIDGNPVSLSDYKGKVVLIVNVASQCGYTPQYETLQGFYQHYKDKGVVVLGFPANNFGGQEPGSNEQIKEFCTSKFSVAFPMFSKISVKGEDMHPLYKYLTGATGQEVKWNFQKFLVGKDGKVIKSYPSGTDVMDDVVIAEVEKML